MQDESPILFRCLRDYVTREGVKDFTKERVYWVTLWLGGFELNNDQNQVHVFGKYTFAEYFEVEPDE